MLFVGTSIIHPSTEGVFLLCNILDLLIYSLEVLQEEIEQIKYEQKKLSSRSLRWLIENDSSENVLSKEVKDNKFLVFLLRRGYLDEKYANYINYFKGNSITTNDMNFILAVKNQESQPFDYQRL